MAKQQYNDRIDVIIPAYNVQDNILFRCLSSIACQDIVSNVDVTIVDDASTEQNYEEVAKRFENMMNVKVLRYDINGGPGVARQYGLDSTYNGFVTFIDADDTFNGSLALKALKTGIDYGGGINAMCVGVFDEIHDALVNGEEVKFAGLGTFKILEKNARMGRNPKTGESALITARRVVAFRPSNEFRERVAKK